MGKVWMMPILLMGLLTASCSFTVNTTESATQTQPAADQAIALAEASTPAQEDAVPPIGKVYGENGIALQGADPVAYFTEAQYVQGSELFTYDWQGLTWYFARAEHRDLFASAPAKYAPQYGGFCAWAVSEGYLAPTDPTAWKVVDGKLYLNYDQGVQADWEKDIVGNIRKGNVNWPKLAKQ